jgi:DNA-binding CsgD family transcriptional regulator
MNNTSGIWWLRHILAANSLAGLRESVALIVQRVGFRYFLLRGRYAHFRYGQSEIRLDNCPAGWVEHCSGNGAEEPDPVHRRALHETTPILWRQCASAHPDFFAEARRFGLITGATYPMHGPNGAHSSLSFMKGVGGEPVEREILAALPECQLLACYVHDAVGRILRRSSDSADFAERAASHRITLTQRERECLIWAATGRTAIETGSALALSKATIVYHLANARRKLGAANSREAVSKAVALKLIALDQTGGAVEEDAASEDALSPPPLCRRP